VKNWNMVYMHLEVLNVSAFKGDNYTTRDINCFISLKNRDGIMKKENKFKYPFKWLDGTPKSRDEASLL